MKLCVKLQLGKAYCVNEIKMLILILSIFFLNFQFFFCRSYLTQVEVVHKLSQKLLELEL